MPPTSSRPSAPARCRLPAALALLALLSGPGNPAWAARTAKTPAATPDPYRLALPADAPYRADLPAPPRSRAHSGRTAPPRPGSLTTVQPALAHRPYAEAIAAAAQAEGVDPALVHAVVAVESNYQPGARSPKGAWGLMQLMPDTARRFGATYGQARPEDNLRAGTRYLRDLLDQFPSRLDLALAAYNAGENAVRRHGNRIPPYAETRQYVPAVMSRFTAWRRTPWQIAATAESPGWRLDAPDAQAAWRLQTRQTLAAALPYAGDPHGTDRSDH